MREARTPRSFVADIRAAAVTVPLVLFAGSNLPDMAFAAATDWQIIASDHGRVVEKICAKSRETCEAAVEAHRRNWFAPDLAGSELVCQPQPGCFSAESEVISGFNDPATLAQRHRPPG